MVDDHEIVRETLVLRLQEEGFEVIGAVGSGRKALNLVDKHKPDVALVDVRMPEMSGAEVTREIIQKSPSTLVVALSMYQHRDVQHEMLEAGASFYFRKDRPWKELISRLKELPARNDKA